MSDLPINDICQGDVDYFYPDRQLVIYYKKMLIGLEARVISVKQKIEAAEKRQKESK